MKSDGECITELELVHGFCEAMCNVFNRSDEADVRYFVHLEGFTSVGDEENMAEFGGPRDI